MLKGWFGKNSEKSNCKHKYNFVRMQDCEDFKRGQLGAAYIYQCEKCGKEKVTYKNNNDINTDFWNI
ncbi:hypothetical protein [Bacillus sp. NPDC094106]|uniref:hypothetical protein n=1 Tax=Bacillus sp. NPDC094106 TaxID=3363949 RepID=UPI0037F853F5